jgi:hypothetical protein
MDTPFIGSEALASGVLNRHQLRTKYQAICPGVYRPRLVQPSLDERIRAAWLWSHREGIVAGLAAAALHGARWIDDNVCVELIHANPRAPQGVKTRRELLLNDEVQLHDVVPVTTPARTAFDIGRRGRVNPAIASLDALMRATDLKVSDIEALAALHPGVRGLRQLETVLELVDPGSQSPKESSLRLLLIRSGLPRPQTQIPVFDHGVIAAYLDMGWPDLMVAVEYDGDHHRTDRRQYLKDIRRYELLERLGWIIVRVVAEDHPSDVILRVRQALESRTSGVR